MAEKTGVINSADSPLHFITNAHGDILTDRGRLLLGNGGHDGDEDFAFGVERVDVLFFKIDSYVLLFQQPDILETIQRVAGETTDGFSNDQVNFMLQTVINHLQKLWALFCLSTADALIRKDAG